MAKNQNKNLLKLDDKPIEMAVIGSDSFGGGTGINEEVLKKILDEENQGTTKKILSPQEKLKDIEAPVTQEVQPTLRIATVKVELSDDAIALINAKHGLEHLTPLATHLFQCAQAADKSRNYAVAGELHNVHAALGTAINKLKDLSPSAMKFMAEDCAAE